MLSLLIAKTEPLVDTKTLSDVGVSQLAVLQFNLGAWPRVCRVGVCGTWCWRSSRCSLPRADFPSSFKSGRLCRSSRFPPSAIVCSPWSRSRASRFSALSLSSLPSRDSFFWERSPLLRECSNLCLWWRVEICEQRERRNPSATISEGKAMWETLSRIQGKADKKDDWYKIPLIWRSTLSTSSAAKHTNCTATLWKIRAMISNLGATSETCKLPKLLKEDPGFCRWLCWGACSSHHDLIHVILAGHNPESLIKAPYYILWFKAIRPCMGLLPGIQVLLLPGLILACCLQPVWEPDIRI